MKKLVILFYISLIYAQVQDTLQIIVSPSSGSVLDNFTIVLYVLNKSTGQVDTSYSGPVYFNINNLPQYNLMNPKTAWVNKGSVTVPNVRIYRAGSVAVYGIAQNGARGASNFLSLSPASPSRIQILYENQNLVSGDTVIGGKEPFTPPDKFA